MVAMHARARAAAGVGTLFVRASEAARRLAVSTKALRVYEHAGLIRPRRSPAGWRLYGPRDLEDARGIIALRVLGVGLADIAALQGADAEARRHLLRAYQATLEARAGAVAAAAEQGNGPSQSPEPESPPEARIRPGRGAPGRALCRFRPPRGCPTRSSPHRQQPSAGPSATRIRSTLSEDSDLPPISPYAAGFGELAEIS